MKVKVCEVLQGGAVTDNAIVVEPRRSNMLPSERQAIEEIRRVLYGELHDVAYIPLWEECDVVPPLWRPVRDANALA